MSPRPVCAQKAAGDGNGGATLRNVVSDENGAPHRLVDGSCYPCLALSSRAREGRHIGRLLTWVVCCHCLSGPLSFSSDHFFLPSLSLLPLDIKANHLP